MSTRSASRAGDAAKVRLLLSKGAKADARYFQSGFPYDHDQWISQAGTAMATIALTLAVN